MKLAVAALKYVEVDAPAAGVVERSSATAVRRAVAQPAAPPLHLREISSNASLFRYSTGADSMEFAGVRELVTTRW
jgi:hypothetical protein